LKVTVLALFGTRKVAIASPLISKLFSFLFVKVTVSEIEMLSPVKESSGANPLTAKEYSVISAVAVLHTKSDLP
jgi:hypothetical protein